MCDFHENSFQGKRQIVFFPFLFSLRWPAIVMVGVLAAILDHAVPLDDAMEKEGHDLIIILEPQ